MLTGRRTLEGILAKDTKGFYLQSTSGECHRLICDENAGRLLGAKVVVSGVLNDAGSIVLFSIDRL